MRVPVAHIALLAAPLATGCADWPRWGHLPEQGDAVEAPDDPRALVEREWAIVDEDEDLPDGPVGTEARVLDLEHATLFEGSLDGLGWNDLATPLAETAPGCNETGAPRHPETIPGEWTGDVDVVVVSAPEGGRICAEIRTDSQEAGWDLLLARLDPCGVPAGFVEGDEGPLGWARGGLQGGWSAPAEAGASYAVILAAYWPTAPDDALRYRLGVSLAGGDLCPLLPEGEP